VRVIKSEAKGRMSTSHLTCFATVPHACRFTRSATRFEFHTSHPSSLQRSRNLKLIELNSRSIVCIRDRAPEFQTLEIEFETMLTVFVTARTNSGLCV
jgi:hypothetical protein